MFIHTPLTQPREIRILKLYLGQDNDPTTGQLEHVSMGTFMPYEALSYEWGSPEMDHQILLEENGSCSELPVTRSLYNALRDLRHPVATQGARIIWADAACIDQSNTIERQQQVSIMASIYRRASRVITYIGPDENGGVQMTEFMEAIWKLGLVGKRGVDNSESFAS